jgi:hypothetical protein
MTSVKNRRALQTAARGFLGEVRRAVTFSDRVIIKPRRASLNW